MTRRLLRPVRYAIFRAADRRLRWVRNRVDRAYRKIHRRMYQWVGPA